MGKKSQETTHHGTEEVLSKLWQLIKQEKRDMWLVVGYSVVIGLLSLVVPLASQAIINSVALGVYTNRFFVLCAAIAIGLLALGIFSVMERHVVDVLQRRLFVRTAFDLAQRLPGIQRSAIQGESLAELVNRFFDLITIQKAIGKFLLDGVSSVLIIITGLLLLAVYHPFFILFDFGLLLFLIFLVLILGQGGLKTSIKESKKKYALVHWLEEVARCQLSFKMSGTPALIFKNVDHISEEYVKARSSHFRVLVRQALGSAVFKAVSAVGVIGIGGALVIERQLTLGQLVAAELVIITILSVLEKLTNQFDDYYDLLTAVDKLSYITEKETETAHGENFLQTSGSAAAISFKNVSFSYPGDALLLKNITVEIPARSRTSIIGASGGGKTTIAALLVGLYQPDAGVIEFDGHDISRLQLSELRREVGLVLHADEIFDGTIEENITMGRNFTYPEIRAVLQTVEAWNEITLLPDGLQTRLSGSGKNLAQSFIRRIMFARAIIGNPKILILDESFGGMDAIAKLRLIDTLYSFKNRTIIDISHDADLLKRAEKVLILDKGEITESGAYNELSSRSEVFKNLFPML